IIPMVHNVVLFFHFLYNPDISFYLCEIPIDQAVKTSDRMIVARRSTKSQGHETTLLLSIKNKFFM
ncbi:hypothetical protein, partial [Escherichia fergusonii]|uniref:hypothetical protein n=1 Tax=Escherichia fergusonii TaxID=564 RepID=UPI001A915BA5